MLNEKVIILVSDRNKYNNMISRLDHYFHQLTVLANMKDFNHMIQPENEDQEQSLLIFFVEYPYLQPLTEQVSHLLPHDHFILVAFSDQPFSGLDQFPALFDSIHLMDETYDFGFFFNKLSAEIARRNQISLLQFEVKEFYEIGKSLTSEKDTVKLFETIINSSINLTSSDAGTLYLVIDKKNGEWSTVKKGQIQDKLLKFVIAKNRSMDIDLETFVSKISTDSIFGYTVITGKSLRIDDVYLMDSFFDYKHDKSYDLKAGYRTKSILTIPMKDHENNIMGVIQLINKKKNRNEIIDYSSEHSLKQIVSYDYTDESIMNSLAGQAAVALENSLLYRDMKDLLESYKKQNEHLAFLTRKVLKAHEEERKRIAREIHDGPAQSAANLSLHLDICRKLLQRGEMQEAFTEMDDFKKEIQATVKDIRTIIYDLKPSYLEGGLIAALKNRFELFKESTGIQLDFYYQGDDLNVEYYLTSTIYRIVQETLSNIYKHANAKLVKVNLLIDKHEIKLNIKDNGKGFDSAILSQKKNTRLEGGFGLEGMKERIELVKGQIEVISSPGKGTMINIQIPL